MVASRGVRRERAAATRRSIVRAAHVQFLERGYHGATMQDIAARAGVATQTVYFVFHTKAELIGAVIDTAVMGEDDPRTPEELPWFAAFQAEPDPAEAIRIFVRGAVDVFARAAGIAEVLRAAALTDDEVLTTHRHHDALRRTTFRQVVDTVSTKGSLRSDRTLDELTDAFLIVVGDSTYHQLTADFGWSRDQVVDWWCEVTPALLLPGVPATRSPRRS